MASLQFESLPASEPVSLDLMKNFLRQDLSVDDELIAAMITAARELCETFTGRCFIARKLRQGIDSFPYFADTVLSQNSMPPSYYSLPRYSTTLWNYSQMIKLFSPPVASVDRISYVSSDDGQWHDLLPATPLWYPGELYADGDIVGDLNDNLQRCTAPGTSAHNPPLWGEDEGDACSETTGVAWINIGPAPTPVFSDTTAQGPTTSFVADCDSEPARIFPGPAGATWPPVIYAPGVVQIHFTSGYVNDPIPSSAVVAIMQTVAHWYENREFVAGGNMAELPWHCKALLWNIRILDFSTTRG
jgi:hypothetical protein